MARSAQTLRWLRIPGGTPVHWFREFLSRSTIFRGGGYNLLRIFLAVLLLTAAALKGHQLATERYLGPGLLNDRRMLTGVVAFELAFGCWLLAGICARASWAVALGCFTSFCGVALYKALSGEVSCGCFGTVPVNPWHTLAFDVGAVAALLVCRPANPSSLIARSGSGGIAPNALVFAGAFVVSLLGAWGLRAVLAAQLSSSGSSGGVYLDPWRWVGQRFPLFAEVDRGDELRTGRWRLVFYKTGCAKCQEALPRYEARARAEARSANQPRIALVDIASSGNPPQGSPAMSACFRARLKPEKRWLMLTPVEVTLDQGVVTKVSEEWGDANGS